LSTKQTSEKISAVIDVWLASGDRGPASDTMIEHLTNRRALRGKRFQHPVGPMEFHRCVVLLNAIPWLRSQLPLMAELSATWSMMVEHWDEIEQTLLAEVGRDWTKKDPAIKTQRLITNLIARVAYVKEKGYKKSV
jgi:hypothetical protein